MCAFCRGLSFVANHTVEFTFDTDGSVVDSGFIIAFDVVPIGVTPFAFQSITTTATTTTPVPQTTTTRALDLIEQDLFRVCEDTEIKDTLAGVVLSHDAFGSNSKSLRQTCTLAIQPDDS